jgi:indolepyruvate ferredoxin oxidoreductase beta subunit
MGTGNSKDITNVVIAGLGGQGVLKASDIVAEAAFRAGLDVKKSEVHGMSQRGGSVTSDVRFGRQVWSPMTPPGEADYMVLLDANQLEPNRGLLRPGGRLIHPGWIDPAALASRKSLNVALIGILSAALDIPEEVWAAAIRASFGKRLHEANEAAFRAGRAAARNRPKGA